MRSAPADSTASTTAASSSVCTNGTSQRAASGARSGMVRHDDAHVDRQRSGVGAGEQVGGAVRRPGHEQRGRQRRPGMGPHPGAAEVDPGDDRRVSEGGNGIAGADRLDLDPLVEPPTLEVAVDVDDVEPGAGDRAGDGGDEPRTVGARGEEHGRRHPAILPQAVGPTKGSDNRDPLLTSGSIPRNPRVLRWRGVRFRRLSPVSGRRRCGSQRSGAARPAPRRAPRRRCADGGGGSNPEPAAAVGA